MTAENGAQQDVQKKEGASTDLRLIWSRTVKLVKPYWIDNPDAGKPRLALAGVIVLSLMTTGVSVAFNFLGRDFFNALSEKNVETFYLQLYKYLAGFAVGIPVFVFRDYFLSLLSLRWREWMTDNMLGDYMADKTFYNVQTGAIVDNPDQRLTSDINNFTSSSLSLAFTFMTSLVDLVSFSGILFSIYPPLFAALVAYAVGGTVVSFAVGKKLVGLNFRQEAREADLRYGLVRVRENAESIAFYNGATSEVGLLVGRLGQVVANQRELLKASRNLDFFQSAYRYIIILLPAAVVAPLYFKGEIEFGVVNQSQSAFSHILTDVSLVVYQFESLAGFSAVVDRLGEFQEAVEARGKFSALAQPESPTVMDPASEITVLDSSAADDVLLRVEGLTLCTPNFANKLVQDLHLELRLGDRLLLMGSSGAGKTSILRALSGLWTSGTGTVSRPPPATLQGGTTPKGMMIVPQRPYMVLGSLRQQLLYPVFDAAIISEALRTYDDADVASNPLDPATGPLTSQRVQLQQHSEGGREAATIEPPSDERLCEVLRQVGLSNVLDRLTSAAAPATGALDTIADWSTMLSLGEQQRLAFARVLLANPAVVLLDESTSALDLENEARLYGLLRASGAAVVSIAHRTSLLQYHEKVLRLEGGDVPEVGAKWRITGVAEAAESMRVPL